MTGALTDSEGGRSEERTVGEGVVERGAESIVGGDGGRGHYSGSAHNRHGAGRCSRTDWKKELQELSKKGKGGRQTLIRDSVFCMFAYWEHECNVGSDIGGADLSRCLTLIPNMGIRKQTNAINMNRPVKIAFSNTRQWRIT